MRDVSGALLSQYFGLGQVNISGGTPTSYFDTNDHLGSVREKTDARGAVQSQFSYSPYGEPAQIAGLGTTYDFGYAGMYAHSRSGLNLTLFRAYNGTLGRWTSRDPIGEDAGTNLYGYVGNKPISFVDPLGLLNSFAPWTSDTRRGVTDPSIARPSGVCLNYAGGGLGSGPHETRVGRPQIGDIVRNIGAGSHYEVVTQVDVTTGDITRVQDVFGDFPLNSHAPLDPAYTGGLYGTPTDILVPNAQDLQTRGFDVNNIIDFENPTLPEYPAANVLRGPLQ